MCGLILAEPGWVAQSVAYPTHDLEVVGSIPGRVELLSGKKCHSPLILKLCEYVVSDMERSSVSTGVRKPGKHDRCADRRDMTIAVKIGVKPQTNKQTKLSPSLRNIVTPERTLLTNDMYLIRGVKENPSLSTHNM